MSYQDKNNNPANSLDEHSIDLVLIFKKIWIKRFLVLIIFSASTLGSLLYSFSIPNIYTSTALLAPSNNSNSSSSSALRSIGSLSAIAGINMPSSELTMSMEAAERLQSFDYFRDHFLPYIKLQDLVAVKRWDEKSKNLIYNEEIFNSSDIHWIEEKPSDQLSYLYFRNIFSVIEDRDTSFVSLSVRHFSPDIAKDWLDIIIRNINISMMNIDRKKSKDAIEFLNIEYSLTNLEPLKVAISSILESQMQAFMMSSINKDYVFKIIESPISPITRSSPNRLLIFIIGSFLGLFLASVLAVGVSYFQERDY